MTDENGSQDKQKKSWTGILALIVALVALFLAYQGQNSSTGASIQAINQAMTDKFVPMAERAAERDVVGHIYDLKRVMVTLEEIKETTTNEDVKAMVDKLRKDIEELNVKLFVHE